MAAMPSPKSKLFRIEVTEGRNDFFVKFGPWYKNHSACEKVYWNTNYMTSTQEDKSEYIIEFNPEKSYANFCTLIKDAMKDTKTKYTITAMKEEDDKKEFCLLYQKNKSLFASILPNCCNSDVLLDTYHKEKDKILSDDDRKIRSLFNFITLICEKKTRKLGEIGADEIYFYESSFCIVYKFNEYFKNINNLPIGKLLAGILDVPFFIDEIYQFSGSQYKIHVKYIYGIQQPSFTPELYYNKDFTPVQLYDFHNRLIAFAKKYKIVAEEYKYPYKALADLEEKVFEDFNTTEHKILKVIQEKEEPDRKQKESTIDLKIQEDIPSGTGI